MLGALGVGDISCWVVGAAVGIGRARGRRRRIKVFKIGRAVEVGCDEQERSGGVMRRCCSPAMVPRSFGDITARNVTYPKINIDMDGPHGMD